MPQPISLPECGQVSPDLGFLTCECSRYEPVLGCVRPSEECARHSQQSRGMVAAKVLTEGLGCAVLEAGRTEAAHEIRSTPAGEVGQGEGRGSVADLRHLNGRRGGLVLWVFRRQNQAQCRETTEWQPFPFQGEGKLLNSQSS